MFKFLKNTVLLLALFTGMTFIGTAKADPGVHIPISSPDFAKVIEFDGAFSFLEVDFIIEEIQESVDEGDKNIIIGLNSPGGSVLAGFRLIHRLQFWQRQGIKFTGVVRELCASMCFVTLQYLDERNAYPLSMLLDHSSSGGMPADHLQINEAVNEKIYDQMRKAGKSEITIKLYKLMVANEFFMNAKTAKDLGLLDKIIIPGEEIKKVEVNKNDKVKRSPAVVK